MKYIRTKPLAATFFKAGTSSTVTTMGAIPRYKYMFYANFVPSDYVGTILYPEYKGLGTWQNGISFKIHAIDRPNVELNLSELNQYNRKRYAYTKVEYQPLNIKIFDTVDDIPLKLWQRYFTYYFGDSRVKGNTTYNEFVTNPTMTDASNWGLNPIAERLNFFDRIEIYALYAGRYTQINLINPKISKVDWQGHDTASSDLIDVSMTIRYEAIEYLPTTAITANDAQRFGFDIEATLEPAGVPQPDRGFSYARTDVYQLINQLRRGGNSNLLSDISQGISNTLNIANSTLNIFNQLPIGAISRDGAIAIGQATRFLNTANSISNTGTQLAGTGTQITNSVSSLTNIFNGGLTTNPASVSRFVGTGYVNTGNQLSNSYYFNSLNFGR